MQLISDGPRFFVLIRMTIIQLEYIVALDTYRNFARAAEKCFVTQPTLSMQIKKLEDELQVTLFDRNKKPVAPTEVGKKVIEQARLSLQSFQKITELVRLDTNDLSGMLRIGIIPTLSPYLLPRLLPSLAEKYPKVNLEIEELLSEQIIEKLHKDLLDVAVWVANKSDQHFVHLPLFYEQFLIYFPDGHPFREETVALSELDISQMWLLQEGHCFRDQVEKLCGNLREHNHHVQFLSGSLETLKKIVDQHFGYTLLPELAVLDLPPAQQKNVRPFKNINPLREVCLTYHQRFSRETLIRAVKSEIRSCIPAELLDEARGDIIPWK